MIVGDEYITISYSLIESEDFKDAWTGSLPTPTLLTVLESIVESFSMTDGRMNEFVNAEGVVSSTDFYIGRATEYHEDDDTILGVAQTFYETR